MIILYIVCFGCYVLFTRQPDYFDSERTTGEVISINNKSVVRYSDGNDAYTTYVVYPFLHRPGKYVEVVYEKADPSKAKHYTFFGYWTTFGELVVSMLIMIVLYFVAVSITNNPTPEALLEQLEASKKKPRKPKYDL